MDLEYNKIYTFSDLREIFHLPQVQGSKSTSQLSEISKKYLLTKKGRNQYIIERELTELEKIDNIKYFKNREYIEPMIYTMLSTSKENSITMDMHELMEETEIVNKDFNYIKYHIKECSSYMEQTEYGLSIFTSESEPMLKRIIRDILYDMEDRQLIKVNEIPVVAFKIYDYDNKCWFTRRKEITSDKDIQELLEIKRKVLNELGLQKESEINYANRSHFRDLIAKEYEAEYFYYKYNIVLNKKDLTLNQNCDIIDLKKSFNKYIQEKVGKSKQGGLKTLTQEEKDIYITYCIDTSQDFKLRERKNK